MTSTATIFAPHRRCLAAALLFAAAIAPPLLAQETAEPAAAFGERLQVRVINFDVVVTDRSGRSVGGLGRDDFELRVDGEVVPISNFYAESGRGEPVTARVDRRRENDAELVPVDEVRSPAERRTHVVIVIDHTRLRENNRKRTLADLREALDRLDPGDLIAVAGIEATPVFYTDFLYDRRAVEEVLQKKTAYSGVDNISRFERRQIFGELARGQSGGLLGRSAAANADENATISRIRAYAAEEFNRSLRSMQQIEAVLSTLAGVDGRKILFYVGEGIPTRPAEGMYVEWRNRFGKDNSLAEIGLRRTDFNTDYTREVGRFDLTRTMDELATAANRAGVTLYAIDAAGDHGAEIRSALTEQGATSETLSVVEENYREPLEHVSKATGGRLLVSSGTLDDQLIEVVGGLRTFYSLGFTPPPEWQPGSDHEVKVTVRGRGLSANFPSQVRLHGADEVEASATLAALLYQSLDNPLRVTVTAGEPVRRDDGETAALPVELAIPAARIGFVPQDGKHAASISIYVVTKDAAGNPGQVQKLPFHLVIPDEFIDQALADAARYTLPVVLRKGDQQVAIGVRDNVNGLLSTLRVDVASYSHF